MNRWCVSENIPDYSILSAGFREFEFAFPVPFPPGHVCKFVRLFPDGSLQLGGKKSPFEAEYTVHVV